MSHTRDISTDECIETVVVAGTNGVVYTTTNSWCLFWAELGNDIYRKLETIALRRLKKQSPFRVTFTALS